VMLAICLDVIESSEQTRVADVDDEMTSPDCAVILL